MVEANDEALSMDNAQLSQKNSTYSLLFHSGTIGCIAAAVAVRRLLASPPELEVEASASAPDEDDFEIEEDFDASSDN